MRMLRLALAEPNLTHAEIATKLEEFGETESTVRDDIRSLRSEGLLELKKPGRKPVAITIREGVPVKDAADEHGVHPKTISRRRQAAGIPPARSPVPDIKRAEILADLADTSVPYWGVAEKHGVSPSTVTRIAKEADLPPRRRGSKSKE
jgi:transposase-like protein